MNKQLARIIMGVGITAIGVGALLGSLDIINFGDFFKDYWPLIVISAGLLMLLANPRQFIWPLIIITWGTLSQLRELEVVNVNMWSLIWPLIIIAVGISFLLNRTHARSDISKKDLDDLTAIFSGTTTKNHSEDYKGGDITAICGGVELDLRKATIKKDASINIFTVWGGITLTVPEDWNVKIRAMPIAGGVENKTTPPSDKNAPTLFIDGDVIMAGVEIKN
jgi:predicted membrane protein